MDSFVLKISTDRLSPPAHQAEKHLIAALRDTTSFIHISQSNDHAFYTCFKVLQF